MAHRGIVALGAVLVLLSSVPLFRVTAVNFTPQDDHRSSTSRCARPRAPAWPPRDVLANRVATAVRTLPEVDFTLVTVAGDAAGTLNIATVFVELQADRRPRRATSSR